MVSSGGYGTWESPISAELVSGSQKHLEGFCVDSYGRLLYLETRPHDSGRGVIVRRTVDADADADADADPVSASVDITPPGYSVRSTAQEYGGGAFFLSSTGHSLIFSNFDDQRLYLHLLLSPDSALVPLTPDYGGPLVRFADGMLDPRFNRYLTVREDHRGSSGHPVTDIVAVDLNNQNQEPKSLISGRDFYAFPRVDPRGERLAWIEWCHPNMHWDKAELWVGYISSTGEVSKKICIAGGDASTTESPSEPKWSDRGDLFFISDRINGFWNIYRWVEHTNEVSSVYSIDAEFSRPLWVYGISSYDFVKTDERRDLLACTYRQNGVSYAGILDVVRNSLTVVDVPLTDMRNIISAGDCLYIEGASAVTPLSLVKVTLDSSRSQAVSIDTIWTCCPDIKQYEPYFATPELIKFPSKGDNQFAYAYFYPPYNPDYVAAQEERPPLLLESHGGPTDEARGSLSLNIQYWTSRGWAFVDVNYGGSSGYGREYRERLLGSWGIVDVDDCCSCAKFLVEKGKVDEKRLCITGCSAGGFTTLASLAFRETFKAGASLFGIADLAMLSAHMHKFESHYIRNLAGSEDALFNRSPINFVEKFSCPIILFQGLEDTIVDPEQAKKIHMALKKKGLPVALVEYEGEPHGFRKAENLKFTLEQQMVFFARTIGCFTIADKVTPIEIENFDQS